MKAWHVVAFCVGVTAVVFLVACLGLLGTNWQTTRYNKATNDPSQAPQAPAVAQPTVEPAPTTKVPDVKPSRGRTHVRRTPAPGRVPASVAGTREPAPIPAAPVTPVAPAPALVQPDRGSVVPHIIDGSSPSTDTPRVVGEASRLVDVTKPLVTRLRRSWLRPPAPRHDARSVSPASVQAP